MPIIDFSSRWNSTYDMLARAIEIILASIWNIDWVWNGQPAIIQSRAIDDTGFVQPTYAQLRKATRPRPGRLFLRIPKLGSLLHEVLNG